MPGQTIEDVCAAEAAFLEAVIARHPEAEGKPVRDRQLPGRLADHDDCGASGPSCSARSSWPVRRSPTGRASADSNPMRYLGGLLGGTWLTALVRRSRRRHLRRRQARRQLRIAEPGQHTIGTSPTISTRRSTPKPRAISTSRPGGAAPVHAERRGDAVDRRRPLRRQQALLGRDPHRRRHAGRPAQHPLADRRALLEGRQHHPAAAGAGLDHSTSTTASTTSSPTARPSSTRCTRRSVISASSSRARSRRKEHAEFASSIDLIDVLPPGLYEAVITEVDATTVNPELDRRRSSCSAARRARSTTSARWAPTTTPTSAGSPRRRALSEINLGLYRTFAQPAVRAMATRAVGRDAARDPSAAACASRPSSDRNPWHGVGQAAGRVACALIASPVSPDNPLLADGEGRAPPGSRPGWETYRLRATRMTEAMFLATYGSPAAAGHGGPRAPSRAGSRCIRIAPRTRVAVALVARRTGQASSRSAACPRPWSAR